MLTYAPESARRHRWSHAGIFAAGAILLFAAILGAAPRPSSAREVMLATGNVNRTALLDSLLASPSEYVGWKYFHVYCFRCHGVDAVGGQLAPDLRHSFSPEGANFTREAFTQVVKEGRLEKGMPAWKTMLTDEQIRGSYDYIKARSERRLAPGRPHMSPPK